MEVSVEQKPIYDGWKEEFRPVLETLSGKNVKLLYSGGKDSSATMDLLSKAGMEFGFEFEAHAGAFPVHRYTVAEKKRLNSYWLSRGQRIIWHQPDLTDEGAENAENPCHYCQQIRKDLMKSILSDTVRDWETLVLIICHSLWDIVSYAIEHILGHVYAHEVEKESAERNRRFRETAQRFYPVLWMKEGYTIFRPMIRFNNDTIRGIIAGSGIPIVSIPCQFKDYRPKRILEKYYENMGLGFDYKNVITFAREVLHLPDLSSFTTIEKEEYLGRVF